MWTTERTCRCGKSCRRLSCGYCPRSWESLSSPAPCFGIRSCGNQETKSMAAANETHQKPAPARAGGAIIGTLGGLIGLGGAEFRLPMLIGLFRFAALEAIILNK